MFFERMRRIRLSKSVLFRIIAVCFASMFLGCFESKRSSTNNPYAALYSDLAVSRIENYVGWETGDWKSRIRNLDPQAKEYMIDLNRIDGFDDSPATSPLFSRMQSEIEKALESIPDPVQSLLRRRLVRIYVCESLGGTAVTGFIKDRERSKGGFILLDAKNLDRKANDWISFKENSSYLPSPTRVRVQIESEKNDTRRNAIRYILLHEFGHILAETESVAPSQLAPTRSFSEFPFFTGVWLEENVSNFDTKEFPDRKKIRFYSGNYPLESEWQNIYPVLENTPFPTLYAANNADDFFAEVFVSYVHVILEKKPWNLTIYQKGKKVYFMENGISKPTLEKQRKIIEQLLTASD